jgi:hypothetical protein
MLGTGLATANVKGHVVAGLALLLGAAVLLLLAAGFRTDYRGLATRFYGRVVQAWDRFPAGGLYRRVVPPGQFRLIGWLGAGAMGVVLLALGIAALVTTPRG